MPAPAEDFSRRLHWALDQARFETGRGRASALAARYAVSRQTARKWLSGLAMPELARMLEMAADFHVSFDWLATGRGGADVKRVADAALPPYGLPISEREMKVVFALRRLPPRQQRAFMELIEVLAD
ncbi:helix-turn-helix domain-containing protein [Luteimonas sp. XNQY3]|nr:helix-turn-helix transcriptional regulator [Luteimonas sp. XNQY3]MCD9004670.1 helix-turn-helix domain-containing protein [Luteimonas sp. XNQY3]